MPSWCRPGRFAAPSAGASKGLSPGSQRDKGRSPGLPRPHSRRYHPCSGEISQHALAVAELLKGTTAPSGHAEEQIAHVAFGLDPSSGLDRPAAFSREQDRQIVVIMAIAIADA